MAGHADAPRNELSDRPDTARRRVVVYAIVVSLILIGVGGRFGYELHRDHSRQQQQRQFLAAARQVALNLATVDHTRVGEDVERIMGSATGPFLDDFRNRAESFAEFVSDAKSTSSGTVTEAGIVSMDGGRGEVLVSLRVTTSTEGAPPPNASGWRMRIEVQQVEDTVKVSNVQFLP